MSFEPDISGKVWVSTLLYDSSAAAPMVETLPTEPMLSFQPEYRIKPRTAPWARIFRGETVAPETLARKFYVFDPLWDEERSKSKPRFVPAFSNAYIFVDHEIAEIMRGFNIAENALHAVEFIEHDTVTPIDVQFYLLNFGAERPTIDVERSERLSRNTNVKSAEEYALPINLKTNAIRILPSALEGPDLWVDKRFPFDFFLSDQLGSALRKAKFAAPLKLTALPKC